MPHNLRGQLQGRLRAFAQDADRLGAARRRLIEAGCAEALVRRFPPSQLILLDERREFEVQWDERTKLLAFPLWQIDSLASDREGERGENGLFADLLPRTIKLCRARGQLERQIALLRHVEALRLHAAGHDGKLPARLCDISVPLPDDPFTGKPFDYTVEGTTAHLRGESCSGDGAEGEMQGPLRGDDFEVIVPDPVQPRCRMAMTFREAGPGRPRPGLAALAAHCQRPMGTQVGGPSLPPRGLRPQPRGPRRGRAPRIRGHAGSAAPRAARRRGGRGDPDGSRPHRRGAR